MVYLARYVIMNFYIVIIYNGIQNNIIHKYNTQNNEIHRFIGYIYILYNTYYNNKLIIIIITEKITNEFVIRLLIGYNFF